MRYLILLLALFCVACGNYSANIPTLKPYKMDIQQGNVVTPKMMMQLRPGMTKSQVRFIMGTPLLVDSFHSDRWDYFYQMRKDGKIIEQRRVILDFDGESLAHVRGDVIPAGTDPASASQPKNTQPRAVVKPAKEKDKGLLDKLKFWGDDEDAKKAAPVEPAKSVEPAKPEVKPEPQPEPQAAPAPQPEPTPEPQPEVTSAPESSPAPAAEPEPPAATPAEPVKAEAVRENAPAPKEPEAKKGLLDKLKFWGDDEKAPAQAAPATVPAAPVKAAPAAAESPAVKSNPAIAEPPPAPRRPSLPETKPKTAPQPPADLPAEDAPEFFEKMLEKIGF